MNDWLAILDLFEAFIIVFVVGAFGYIALDTLFGVMLEYGEE